MTDLFDAFWPALYAREGGAAYTDRDADRGGPTRHGITAAKLGDWRGLGRAATPAEVQALGVAEAYQIYRAEFWSRPGFEKVAQISARIAEELLDTGVNMGPRWPGRWLQRTLNLCNQQGTHWPDLAVDGDLGPYTRQALQALIQRRGVRAGEDLVLTCLNGFQWERYRDLAEAGGPNNDQERNFVGWVAQRIRFDA